MFRNLFFAAVLAALCAGLLNSAIQHFRVTPLILAAEHYEGEAHAHSHEGGSADAAAAAHLQAENEWAPQDGFERTAYTVLANVLVAISFALILMALSLFADLPITFGNGALWGMAGFLAVSLAPAFGLAPELPGMPAGEVLPRQIWWFGTVLATGGAILIIAKTRAAWAFAVAVLLIAAPHIIGAPQPPDQNSAVPAHLATEFAAAALGTAAVFWVVLGLLFGRFNDLFARRASL